MKRPLIIVLLTIALVFVLAGIAAVVFFAVNGGFTNNPFDVPLFSAQVEENKALKVDTAQPLTLNMTNKWGDVTITGADVDTVQVKAIKTAYAKSQARADEEVKTIKYSVEQAGNSVTIKYELPQKAIVNKGPYVVDFIVVVPNRTTVDIDGGMGNVSVSDINGSVTVENDFGEVDVKNTEGSLSVSSNSGEVTATSIRAGSEDIELTSNFGAVTLKNASGNDIELSSKSGKVTLNEVRATGEVTTQTDFGDTEFENGSASSLNIESNSGGASLLKLKVNGQIKVNSGFGEIELEQAIGGSYDLHTNSGSISVDGVKGALTATTDFGGIKIENAQSVMLDLVTRSGSVEFSGSLGEGPHRVESEFGEINLTLPADSVLTVDFKTGFGNIKSDLPITVTLTESSNPADSHEIVGSINGGGAQLTVKTNSGNITIRTASK